MGLTDFKHLKDLSWYTTVPLIVCAWMFQGGVTAQLEAGSITDFVLVIGEYFAYTVGALLLAYFLWTIASDFIDTEGLPFTLLFATFLLTLGAAGIALHLISSGSFDLPINFLWFFAFGSVAFNLFQIRSNVLEQQTKSENKAEASAAENNQ
ncbi:hypothetical protein [Alcanivorax sp.]|uniref:hypothetical protein n=1 Tax=Alcanivorax sp. TaxID=1872427 RepID=UPI0039E2EA33